MSMKRVVVAACVVLGLLTGSAFLYNALAEGGNQNPGVIPPNANYRGHSYGEWEARWWQTLFAIPVVGGDHPLISGGAFAEVDGVMFLAAPVGIPSEFEITITPGTALFFPLLNTECSVLEPDPFHGDDEASLRECANGLMDDTSDLFAEIDGVPVNAIQAYRVESPLFEWGPLPENNIFQFFGLDAPAGTTSLAVDAGYYLMLAPLRVGRHTIHFGGTIGGVLSGFVDATFVVHVVPREP